MLDMIYDSVPQKLSHLSKLNDVIISAVQTANQELASFGSLNKRVVGNSKLRSQTLPLSKS